MSTTRLSRVYVWEMPVRIFHWINAACILTLGVTGYLIGSPPALQASSEASFSYWFATVRVVHFSAAYLMVFGFLFRIYWGFVGNRFASWRSFLPITGRQWKEIGAVLKVDILQVGKATLPSVGHNALASLTYFASFLVFVVSALTGFALYGATSHSLLASACAWVVPLFGGDASVRQWHHLLLWFYPVFVLTHVYLVAFHDYVEGRGVTSSMVSGWKFVEEPDKVDGGGE